MAGSEQLLNNIGQALQAGGAKPQIKVKVKVKVPMTAQKRAVGPRLSTGRQPSRGRY